MKIKLALLTCLALYNSTTGAVDARRAYSTVDAETARWGESAYTEPVAAPRKPKKIKKVKQAEPVKQTEPINAIKTKKTEVSAPSQNLAPSPILNPTPAPQSILPLPDTATQIKRCLNDGKAALKRNDTTSAYELFEQGLKLAPANVELMQNSLLALYRLDLDQAMLVRANALDKIKPQDSTAIAALAAHMLKCDRLEAADNLVKRALAIGPNPLAYIIASQIAGQRKETGKALDLVAKAGSGNGMSTDAMIARARIYELLEDRHNAELTAIRLQKTAPVDGALLLASLYAAPSQNKLDQAFSLCQKAISLSPNFFPAYLEQAAILSRQGEYEAALQSIERVLEIQPDWDRAYSAQSAIYQAEGKYDLALGAMDRAIALAPKNGNYAVERLKTLVKADHIKQALNEAQALVATDCGANALTACARVLIELNEKDKSKAAIEKALKISGETTSGETVSLAINILRRAQEPDKAIDLARNFLKTPGLDALNRAEVTIALSQCYLHRGQVDRAIALINQAISARPDFRIRLAKIYLLIDCGQWEQSLFEIDQLGKKTKLSHQETMIAESCLAASLAGKGREKEAAESLEDTLKHNPREILLYRQLCKLYLDMGQNDAAYQTAARLMDLMPSEVEGYCLAIEAKTKNDKNDLKQAQNIAERGEKLLTNQEGRNALQLALSDVYLKMRDYKKADEIVEKLRKDRPDNVWLLLHQAELLAAAGQADKAMANLQKAQDINRHDRRLPPARFAVMLAKNDIESAQRALQDTLQDMDWLTPSWPNTHLLNGLMLEHLGKAADAREEFVKASYDSRALRQETWPQPLLQYGMGKLTEAELEKKASSPADKGEAHFYIAMRKINEGKMDEAKDLLNQAFDELPASFTEFSLASILLKARYALADFFSMILSTLALLAAAALIFVVARGIERRRHRQQD